LRSQRKRTCPQKISDEENKMPMMRDSRIPSPIISLVCAASLLVFGCGGDSSSSPSVQNDVCSVTKTANSVTVKSTVDGASTTTIYVFGTDGNMVSETIVTDFSDVDDATAKAICDANASVEGITATYENGQCTVVQKVGLAGSLEDIYEAQSIVCDVANEATKPSSSSVGKNTNGSSSSTEEKTVTEVDDLTALAVIKCNSSTLGDKVFVKSEDKDYVCASYESSGMDFTTWFPTIDDIKNAPTCSQNLILGDDDAIYFSEKDNTIYACVLDITDPYNFDDAEYVWKNYGEFEVVSSASVESSSSEISTVASSSSAVVLSSASTTKEKVVTFKDGIIWEPSYKSRARTFFNTVDEYNFLDSNSATGDSSGWWFKYLDEADGGVSTATGVFGATALDLSITLKYINWYVAYDGSYYYNAPDPYPYAGFGFNWSTDGDNESVDLSDWTGICITYESTKSFEVAIPAVGDGDFAYYYPVTYSSSPKTIDIPFSSLTRSQYATTSFSRSSALKNATALHIKYTNDETKVQCDRTYYTASECGYYFNSYSNSIQIYRIGKYGSCTDTGTIL